MKPTWTTSRDADRPGSLFYEAFIGKFRTVVSETSVNEWQYMMFEGTAEIPTVMSVDFPSAQACMEAFEADLEASAEEMAAIEAANELANPDLPEPPKTAA